MLSELLSVVVLAGLTAASLLVCFEKWGWLRAWEVFGPRWFPRCDFCAGFWCSLGLLTAAVSLLGLPWWWLGGALPAAALCRFVFSLR